jgi:hypothetical protein
MNEALRKSNQMTLEDSRNVISSLALVAGPTRSDLPVGQTMNLFGPEAVPVNHSVPAADKKVSVIPAISGRRGFGSSASADLQRSLESRLVPRLALHGSTMFRLTWKTRVTPSGRRIYALRALARSISDNGFGSWPTTTKEDARSSPRHGYMEKGNQGTTLLDASRLATWPTPTEGDANNGTRAGGQFNSLTRIWASPSARDWKDTSGMATTGTNPDGSERTRLDQLPRQVGGLVSGVTSNGSTAKTESTGQLNPAFSLWLMGYRTEWVSCGARAMQSSRKSRKRS